MCSHLIQKLTCTLGVGGRPLLAGLSGLLWNEIHHFLKFVLPVCHLVLHWTTPICDLALLNSKTVIMIIAFTKTHWICSVIFVSPISKVYHVQIHYAMIWPTYSGMKSLDKCYLIKGLYICIKWIIKIKKGRVFHRDYVHVNQWQKSNVIHYTIIAL